MTLRTLWSVSGPFVLHRWKGKALCGPRIGTMLNKRRPVCATIAEVLAALYTAPSQRGVHLADLARNDYERAVEAACSALLLAAIVVGLAKISWSAARAR